ncbi:ImmA/IrrE family metallo-endopeptidase [Bradyrhizobium sp. NP1]|uniref:ImmA/IrrE family metallo-endopeptidase n=1 Tax=Bradyrhizobium sp. NP1 TaxID=3049772 RepID=UPI0025A67ECD|nr:ImmA/IrrE family metallo-endopeptidase [Bradyrhizobium sp. NP1]WJR74930.1 ImmA/IrrE family metallo-endopeptidase [Bradyrhizobium sp. NP1]
MTPAEALLQELGVTQPDEIDLEAIAFHVGARVRFRMLCGCEAHIIGCNGAAVITVKSDSSGRRKRFSIAHELGHWRYHRGKRLVCRVDEYRPRDMQSPEKVADAYAADLLMPRYLFQPHARTLGKLSFGVIEALGTAFRTSLTATAIRLVDLDHIPAFIVCHGSNGRRWFARAPTVPRHWFPRDELDPKSSAFGVQFGGRSDDGSVRKVGADAWFECNGAAQFTVLEQTVRVTRDETISLVVFDDRRMLAER